MAKRILLSTLRLWFLLLVCLKWIRLDSFYLMQRIQQPFLELQILNFHKSLTIRLFWTKNWLVKLIGKKILKIQVLRFWNWSMDLVNKLCISWRHIPKKELETVYQNLWLINSSFMTISSHFWHLHKYFSRLRCFKSYYSKHKYFGFLFFVILKIT